MKKTIFTMTWGLSSELTGMNRVMLRRAKLLSNKKYQSVILTSDYKRDYGRLERELRATGLIHPEVKLINIYEYYRQKFSSKVISTEAREYFEKSRVKFEDNYWVEDGGNYARYFDNGQYVKYKSWDNNGDLKFIDYFDENRVRISRNDFHELGYRSRETLFHPANNKKNQENYYTPDGFCFLTIWYNYETGAQQQVFLFDPKFSQALNFRNRPEFHKYWLDELCGLEAVKPIVITEDLAVADRLAKLDDDKAYKIFMLHNNHLSAPYTAGSKNLKAANKIIEQIPKGYTTVVLTKSQQLDLHSDIGNRGNIFVIPNFVETSSPAVEKRGNVFLIVSKLTAERQIDHAIKAMEIVVKANPNAELEICGNGAELVKLEKLVKELKLDKHIRFKGYVAAIDPVYASSLATMITSESEGMNYSYQESAINGTPTISYKINYGTSEWIEHDVNGLLVEANQIDELAEAMIQALDNPEHMANLGNAARIQAEEQFTEEIFRDNWLNLIEHTITNSPKINII